MGDIQLAHTSSWGGELHTGNLEATTTDIYTPTYNGSIVEYFESKGWNVTEETTGLVLTTNYILTTNNKLGKTISLRISCFTYL